MTITSVAPPAGKTPPERLDPAVIRLGVVLVTGVLAVVFDTTIVSVALRTLATDLRVPVATIQWVSTGYLLALGMVVPVTGWLVARIGGKHAWMAALVLFLLGSIGSSLAWNAGALIGFRVLQGIGGGLMLPVLQTLLVQASGGRNLGRIAAMVAMPALLGPILGPVVGGVIVQNLSWRWMFWVNVPLCVASMILAWRMMPADGPRRSSARLDIVGLLLLSPGIALLLYGLSQIGSTGGFGHPSVLFPGAAGLVLLAGFTAYALRGKAPIVDLSLFRVRSFAASAALMFLSGFVLYGAMLALPLYFQVVRGHDALGAGLLLVPQGIGALGSRSLAGTLTDRIGPRWVVFAGMAVVLLGTVPFALAGPSTQVWITVVALLVRGLGLGAVMIPIMAAAYEHFDRTRIPDASIITRTVQQIGGSFGSAVIAVVIAHQLVRATPSHAFDVAFWWSIAVTLVAVLCALWIPPRRPTSTP